MWTAMKRIMQWRFWDCSSRTRASKLNLLTEVTAPDLWSDMLGLAWASCAELDQFRYYHNDALYTSALTSRNSVSLVWTCILQCRMGRYIFIFWTQPKMENLILLTCNRHLGTDGKYIKSIKGKRWMPEFEICSEKCSVIGFSLEVLESIMQQERKHTTFL